MALVPAAIKCAWSAAVNSQTQALACIDNYLAGADPSAYCDNPATGKE